MILFATKPSVDDLYKVIEEVPGYPVSVNQLISIADKTGAPKEVSDFYGAFGKDQAFTNQEDLVSRTEQVEIMHREEMPKEDFTASEED